MSTYRVKLKDIRNGKSAYMVTMGRINKIVFTGTPRIESYKFQSRNELCLIVDCKYIDLDYNFSRHAVDYGLIVRRRYLEETNAMFTNLKAAERFVALTKKNREEHLKLCREMDSFLDYDDYGYDMD